MAIPVLAYDTCSFPLSPLVPLASEHAIAALEYGPRLFPGPQQSRQHYTPGGSAGSKWCDLVLARGGEGVARVSRPAPKPLQCHRSGATAPPVRSANVSRTDSA